MKGVHMLELEQSKFHTLTKDHLDEYVPSCPGVYILAIRLANGVHQVAYTSQADNLYGSLRSIIEREPTVSSIVHEILNRYQCYFSYVVIDRDELRGEVEKMLVHSSDPLSKLTVINCN